MARHFGDIMNLRQATKADLKIGTRLVDKDGWWITLREKQADGIWNTHTQKVFSSAK